MEPRRSTGRLPLLHSLTGGVWTLHFLGEVMRAPVDGDAAVRIEKLKPFDFQNQQKSIKSVENCFTIINSFDFY
jgi:hypothetical protein